MDTLTLLNTVASHLSGMRVEVKIQEPLTPGARGEMWIDNSEEPALKIAISPGVVWEGEQYFQTFLHEVAHAALHVGKMSPDGDDPNFPFAKMALKAGDGLEFEAGTLAWRWHALADENKHRYAAKAENDATRLLHNRLVALLDCTPDQWKRVVNILQGY
jgi:hypothetical protein